MTARQASRRRTNMLGSISLALMARLAIVAVALAACTAPPDVTPQFGNLVVLVNGLPTGATGSVTVTGPSGFSEVLSASETFAGLTPSSYTVSAASVSYQGISYIASVSGTPATVVAGNVATATVTYAATSMEPGALNVTIDGLPGGVDADVSVSGPSAFAESITASTVFGDAEPGTYTVTAASVDDGGDVYAPTVSGSPATVPAGGSTSVTVTYSFLDPGLVGALQVDISGLPTGSDAAVNVGGPGFDQDLTTSATLTDLVPAFYTVTATTVTVDGLDYAATVTTSPTLVIPEETATVTVAYNPLVPNDGDAASAAGVFAQFRVTAGAPVWVEGLLFNSGARIDTKGIQLRDRLGDPADPGDFINFRLVHGQAPTTSVKVTLECGAGASPSLIRADLRTLAGAKIGQSTLCDSTKSISVPNDGGVGEYVLHIVPVFNQPYYTDYTVSINAYCGQTCTFQPYQP